ncbi:MAG: hypothetical protein HWE13_02675 [Gammaproteobacteria bacterium]|nr:hypothetical protein [Gammaproteobacteria bacterium]
MTCPCDEYDFPQLANIAAGLATLPRSLGYFPEWRLALLDDIGAQSALAHWRARDDEDFGMMLVEMAAYVFDVVSFYDEVIANNSYLTTCYLSKTPAQLTQVLGYVPRPAIASEVWLALQAEGRQLIEVAEKTAFRSGEFADQAPQVFELTQSTQLEPRINRLTVARVKSDVIQESTLTAVYVAPNSLRVAIGQPVVLSFDGELEATYVAAINSLVLPSKQAVSEIVFSTAVTVPAGATFSKLRVFTLGNVTSLWQRANPFNGNNVALESRAGIRNQDIVLFENSGELKVRTVQAHNVIEKTVLSGLTSSLVNADGEDAGEVTSPDIKATVSDLTLNSALGWSSSERTKINLYFSLSDAAKVIIPEKNELENNDPLMLPNLVDVPRVDADKFLLNDQHQEGALVSGRLDSSSQSAIIDDNSAWSNPLSAPVEIFANVVKATRGESVQGELLGNGDGSSPWQSFELKKKPLTYLAAENAKGFQSTLEVFVDGQLWTCVDSFFGCLDDQRVYTVVHDEEQNTRIEFGGGARLPSGATVTANYRFGAGAAVPPAHSITQLARPVVGIAQVTNVLPAFGGGDAESVDDLKAYAPNTALLMGRTISLVDLEAAAHRVMGVAAVKGVMRWDKNRFAQKAVIYYIGDPQLSASVLSHLQSMSEPDAFIEVKCAEAQPMSMQLDLVIASDFIAADVVAKVRHLLTAAATPSEPAGLLNPTRLGPEGAVYFSTVMAAVLQVPGVSSIAHFTINSAPISGYGIKPNAECYFDFISTSDDSGISINGEL